MVIAKTVLPRSTTLHFPPPSHHPHAARVDASKAEAHDAEEYKRLEAAGAQVIQKRRGNEGTGVLFAVCLAAHNKGEQVNKRCCMWVGGLGEET